MLLSYTSFHTRSDNGSRQHPLRIFSLIGSRQMPRASGETVSPGVSPHRSLVTSSWVPFDK